MMEVDEESEERMCRYCFDGDEDEELISPCSCRGGQKWVHLACLRRWQRMVLVQQPTHPSFYKDDERHHICSVCKSEFNIEPPTRLELMRSFTGPEIAVLIDEGCIIAARDYFTQMLEEQLAQNPLLGLMASYHHWIRGAYLITSVKEDDGKLELEVDDLAMLRGLRLKMENGNQLKLGDQTYILQPAGPLANSSDLSLENLPVPCKLSFLSEKAPNCSNDTIWAVNLTRPQSEPTEEMDININRVKRSVEKAYPDLNVKDVEIQVYVGGPVDENSVIGCVVPGGGRGYTYVPSLARGIALAARRSVTDESKGFIATGDTVELCNLQNKPELNGENAVAKMFCNNSQRWVVALLNSGQVKRVKPANLKRQKSHPVMVFFGNARWTRAQLLGEIAKGHWGLCKSTLNDLYIDSTKRREAVDGRLVFSPETEMTDEYIKQAEREMDRMRQGAVAAGRHAQPDEAGEENQNHTANHDDDAGDGGATIGS